MRGSRETDGIRKKEICAENQKKLVFELSETPERGFFFWQRARFVKNEIIM